MGVWVGLCRVSEWLELVFRCVELGGGCARVGMSVCRGCGCA